MMQVAVMVVAADAAVSLSSLHLHSTQLAAAAVGLRTKSGLMTWYVPRRRRAQTTVRELFSYCIMSTARPRCGSSTTRSAPEAVQEVKHDRHATSTVKC